MHQYRQGDVLIARTNLSAVPNGAEKQKPDGQRVILAYGEATGHAHAIDCKLADMYQWQGDQLLEVKPGAVLGHEEHTHIPLPPGVYKVTIQKEYSPERIRNVAD